VPGQKVNREKIEARNCTRKGVKTFSL